MAKTKRKSRNHPVRSQSKTTLVQTTHPGANVEDLSGQQDWEQSVQIQTSSADDLMMQWAYDHVPAIKQVKSVDIQPTPKPRKQSARFRQIAERRPDDTLDLHGATQEQAIWMLQNFIRESYRKKLSSVLVITGKGKHSGNEGPVLNIAAHHWLERNGHHFVKHFTHAPARLGGKGAIWVDLL